MNGNDMEISGGDTDGLSEDMAIFKLNTDCWTYISSYLDTRSILNLSMTCKAIQTRLDLAFKVWERLYRDVKFDSYPTLLETAKSIVSEKEEWQNRDANDDEFEHGYALWRPAFRLGAQMRSNRMNGKYDLFRMFATDTDHSPVVQLDPKDPEFMASIKLKELHRKTPGHSERKDEIVIKHLHHWSSRYFVVLETLSHKKRPEVYCEVTVFEWSLSSKIQFRYTRRINLPSNQAHPNIIPTGYSICICGRYLILAPKLKGFTVKCAKYPRKPWKVIQTKVWIYDLANNLRHVTTSNQESIYRDSLTKRQLLEQTPEFANCSCDDCPHSMMETLDEYDGSVIPISDDYFILFNQELAVMHAPSGKGIVSYNFAAELGQFVHPPRAKIAVLKVTRNWLIIEQVTDPEWRSEPEYQEPEYKSKRATHAFVDLQSLLATIESIKPDLMGNIRKMADTCSIPSTRLRDHIVWLRRFPPSEDEREWITFSDERNEEDPCHTIRMFTLTIKHDGRARCITTILQLPVRYTELCPHSFDYIPVGTEHIPNIDRLEWREKETDMRFYLYDDSKRRNLTREQMAEQEVDFHCSPDGSVFWCNRRLVDPSCVECFTPRGKKLYSFDTPVDKTAMTVDRGFFVIVTKDHLQIYRSATGEMLPPIKLPEHYVWTVPDPEEVDDGPLEDDANGEQKRVKATLVPWFDAVVASEEGILAVYPPSKFPKLADYISFIRVEEKK